MVCAHVISLSDFHKSSRNPPCCHFLGLKSSEIKHFRPTWSSYKVKYYQCHEKPFSPFFLAKNKTTHLEKTFWPTPKMYLIMYPTSELEFCTYLFLDSTIHMYFFFLEELRKFTIIDFPKQTHFGRILINLFFFFTH